MSISKVILEIEDVVNVEVEREHGRVVLWVSNGTAKSKARTYNFSAKTRERAIELLENGTFTIEQMAVFLGLKDGSVHSLLTELRRDHVVAGLPIGGRRKIYSIEN
tara:strand:+ start:539 stop:856 length:318 start_codon:yes stop_codon:yes gene_type:complete